MSSPLTAPTLSQAQAYILNSSTAQAAWLNRDLQNRYDMAVQDFNANMETGQHHDPPLKPPVAPKSWVVLPPNEDGFQFYAQSGPPLTPTPPLTLDTVDVGTNTLPNNPLGTMVLGILIPGTAGIYQALKGDTCAEGTTKTIPGPDGGLITLRKHSVPWGGYWERIG